MGDVAGTEACGQVDSRFDLARVSLRRHQEVPDRPKRANGPFQGARASPGLTNPVLSYLSSARTRNAWACARWVSSACARARSRERSARFDGSRVSRGASPLLLGSGLLSTAFSCVERERDGAVGVHAKRVELVLDGDHGGMTDRSARATRDREARGRRCGHARGREAVGVGPHFSQPKVVLFTRANDSEE